MSLLVRNLFLRFFFYCLTLIFMTKPLHRKREFMIHAIHQIQNSIQLIQMDYEEQENQINDEFSPSIEIQLDYLGHLLPRLKEAYPALENPKKWLRIDLCSLCQKLFYTFSVMGKSYNFKLECPLHEILLQADIFLLEEAFRICIENAFKYSPEGADIIFSLSENEDWITVTLKNTGIGISTDLQSSLLRPKAIKTLSGNQGMGMGLKIAHKIINKHGGHMNIHSDGHSQVTVQFNIPK